MAKLEENGQKMFVKLTDLKLNGLIDYHVHYFKRTVVSIQLTVP